MTNHYHLLVETIDGNLSKDMRLALLVTADWPPMQVLTKLGTWIVSETAH